ncbi:AtpZ/AtpI family protein [Paenibacillus pinistramenti]|uniref:AtpZ/AtpI family protein n=1 Tax=Paenibacillus pinistramenti TaxID=1768003 RepID=UPI001108A868|nr:AtpZ/AtpI family protein [Paenibacillus pinistramenti]
MDKPDHSKNTDKSGSQNGSNHAAWKMAGTVSMIGIDFTVCTMAGFYLGSWGGNHFGNKGIWIAVSVLGGMIAGILGAVAIIRGIMRESNE